MKFAFSTVACPKWDFETIAAKAKEYGYDGVEVRAFMGESILTASNVFHTDPAKLKSMFKYHGIEIACLASSVTFAQNKKKDAQSAAECKQFIDTAVAIGCPLVKIFDTQVKAGQSRAAAGIEFAKWLIPLADYAADHDVTIVVENALSFRGSKEMWAILDRVNHPSAASCWDVFNAALIGETPAVSVPTLNNRIQYVQLKDAKLGPLGATLCKIGEGSIQVGGLIRRLMGIGYTDYLCLEWEKAWLPGIAEPEDILPDSIKKLKELSKPQLEEEEEKKPAEAAAAH